MKKKLLLMLVIAFKIIYASGDSTSTDTIIAQYTIKTPEKIYFFEEHQDSNATITIIKSILIADPLTPNSVESIEVVNKEISEFIKEDKLYQIIVKQAEANNFFLYESNKMMGPFSSNLSSEKAAEFFTDEKSIPSFVGLFNLNNLNLQDQTSVTIEKIETQTIDAKKAVNDTVVDPLGLITLKTDSALVIYHNDMATEEWENNYIYNIKPSSRTKYRKWRKRLQKDSTNSTKASIDSLSMSINEGYVVKIFPFLFVEE